MARANAANVSAQAGTLQGLARALTGPAHLKMAEYEPWLRRLVPLMVAVFMTTLAVGALIQGRDARDRAIADAVGDVELIVGPRRRRTSTRAIAARSQAERQPKRCSIALPGRAMLAGGQVLVSDLAGNDRRGRAPRTRDWHSLWPTCSARPSP